jgi:hypothetical protein
VTGKARGRSLAPSRRSGWQDPPRLHQFPLDQGQGCARAAEADCSDTEKDEESFNRLLQLPKASVPGAGLPEIVWGVRDTWAIRL